MTRTTFRDVENAFHQLAKLLPKANLALERTGHRFRVICRDGSRPFGSNLMAPSEAYEILWFAVNALRLSQ